LEDEEVDPLFAGIGLPDAKTSPVQFIADDGQYRAGEMATTEKKKLPADALAIVQQMTLWHPNDTRLYWLLSELYNAEGDIEAALQLFDFCVARGYSPTLLKEHRRIVQTAVETLRATKAKELQDKLDQAVADALAAEQTALEQRKRTQWIMACVVAGGLLLLYLQIQEIRRRFRRRRS
jgi:hypothetical protein